MKPLEPSDSLHVQAAQGWLELGNHIEADAELDNIDGPLRAHPDVLKERWEIYAAAKKWEAALDIAAAIVHYCGKAFEPTKETQRCRARKRCMAAQAAVNRERFAACYAANRDRILKRQAAYYAANRVRIAKRHAAYNAANRDKIAKYQAACRAAKRLLPKKRGRK
jgi:hypothetical protein